MYYSNDKKKGKALIESGANVEGGIE